MTSKQAEAIQRAGFVALCMLVAALAMLLPVILGVQLAQQEADRREHRQLQAFADAAAQLAQRLTGQAAQALFEMARLPYAPCSPGYMTQLRRITFSYQDVRDAGAQDGKVRLCSALLGPEGARKLPFPSPQWHGKYGFDAWSDVANPFGAKHTVLLLGLKGHYVSLDPAAYVDLADPGMRHVVVFNAENDHVFAATPGADTQQMLAAFHHGNALPGVAHVFVSRATGIGPLSVVASMPRGEMLVAWRPLLLSGLAAGLLCGGVLTWLVLRMMAQRFSLAGQLQQAVQRREFIVHYQPIIDLGSGRCVGAEALLRWQHHRQLVRPDLFIPLAESAGLIPALTDQVLDITLAELGPHLASQPTLYVSINVSAADLKTPRFLDVMTRQLAGTGIAPAQIRIEATERGFLDAEAASHTIAAFRSAGHPVYIDDFGTGYSSLSYLQHFRVDVLKIDKSFVDTIGQDAASSSVASHIIDMAHTLDLQVVAEGIEHAAQARYLQEHGAQYGQGWLFAKAMPAADFLLYLASRNAETPPSAAPAVTGD